MRRIPARRTITAELTVKPFTVLSFLAASVLTVGSMSCKKKEAQADATRPLQQSFQTAEPETRQVIETVNTSLKTGNYTEATRALAPLVSRRNLTEPQKQAVGVALKQINQAIAANPALDTKEMYELRAKMFRTVDSGPRF
jgi:uncharacterized caspase-like protein